MTLGAYLHFYARDKRPKIKIKCQNISPNNLNPQAVAIELQWKTEAWGDIPVRCRQPPSSRVRSGWFPRGRATATGYLLRRSHLYPSTRSPAGPDNLPRWSLFSAASTTRSLGIPRNLKYTTTRWNASTWLGVRGRRPSPFSRALPCPRTAGDPGGWSSSHRNSHREAIAWDGGQI